ncbi:MAG TPA: type II toxin-antitoxin system YafQ family toxin [Isosphaeraceae bacterium]|nr:type II toxin-antitoxin system YafQ family toxin [Isosphaeraceae bacterium]
MSTPGGLRLRPTKAFERDLKRLQKRGKDMSRLRDVLERIRNDFALEPRHRDHPLSGEWSGWRDCHIEGDWVLIYRVDRDSGEVLLGRSGTHSDLF